MTDRRIIVTDIIWTQRNTPIFRLITSVLSLYLAITTSTWRRPSLFTLVFGRSR